MLTGKLRYSVGLHSTTWKYDIPASVLVSEKIMEHHEGLVMSSERGQNLLSDLTFGFILCTLK